jgi:hypothetical protein
VTEPSVSIKAYLPAEPSTVICNLGEKHRIVYCTPVMLTHTGRTVPYDNGYTTDPEPVLVDEHGYEWVRHSPFDYAGSTSYYSATLNLRALSRLPYQGVEWQAPPSDSAGSTGVES